MNTKRKQTGFEVAVIGMSGRFPAAKDINAFWDNLKQGMESISFSSDEEARQAGESVDLLEEANYVKTRGGQLEDKEFFDAFFFNYTPAEAEVMDPQFRLFHECAYTALENAGYNPGSFPGKIGLYAGFSSNLHWKALTLFSGKNQEVGSFTANQLTDKDFLSTRIAYKLNLKGPAVVVQTACSTSLVAIHMACRALLMKECDMVMAGGISVSSAVNTGYLYEEGMTASPDGHCRAFDARAAGIAGGQGVGIVVLKRLKQAEHDRDTIRAVVLGSAINNDGIRKVGYTAPSVEGQMEAIKLALHLAKSEPESIGYVETHGSGTVLGDPVEIAALKQAFNTGKKGYCAIGSVKTNIGHLDAAAGAAGFIKTVLALQHKQIPPSLNFEKSNPKIDFKNSPFFVNTTLREWENNGYPLRAGVSSFGIGGTNAHVVLEEAPQLEKSSESRPWQMIFLSAKTTTALNRAAENLAAFLKKNPGINLADAAYTLQLGRAAHQHRKMLVCTNAGEAIRELSSLTSQKVETFYSKTENPPLVFMFPGLGTQYVNMGLDLYRTEAAFREEMDRCFQILKPLTGYDPKEILYPPENSNNPPAAGPGEMKDTGIAQPLLFIFEYALAKLLMKWGIEPRAMIGYSLGEYVAACIAGVFSLEEALKLVVSRGKLIRRTPGGVMLSAPLTREQVKPFLNNRLSLAIDNDESCIIAGLQKDIDAFEKQMKENRYMCMRLPNSHAVHSKVMEPILAEFRDEVVQIPLREPKIPYISNVTGHWLTGEQALDPNYWAAHLRHTVQFADGIKELSKIKNTIFVEIGPGRTLSGFVRQQQDKKPDQFAVNLTRNPREDFSDVYYLLKQMGRLWLHGISPNWQEFYAAEKRRRIPLPTYSFDARPYRIESNDPEIGARMLSQSQLSRKADITDCFYIPSWENTLSLPPGETDINGCSHWLVFLDDRGLASRLVKRLEKEGQEITTVKKGTEFHRLEPGRYSLKPGDSAGYDTLFKELRDAGKIPGKIIHLWSLTGNVENEEINEDNVDRSQDFGLYSLIYIARAIGKLDISQNIRLGVVTGHVYDVTGEEVICPARATIQGAVKVIPQEYPFIRCCTIDVVLSEPGESAREKTVGRLFREFGGKFTGEVIAFRNNRRLVQTFTPVRLEKHLEARAKLREEGVYLITGGLGNVGLVLAKYLAQKVKARLILTGRSSFPGRCQWKEWLDNHNEENTWSRNIREIQDMEEKGARVLVLTADVSNRGQMQRAIKQGEEEFGPINGVIHAAGIIGPRTFKSIAESTKSQYLRQFKPKVHGLLVLEKVLGGKPLDFCMLTSSLSPILGGLGFSAYSAANSFMDAYAQYHNQVSPVPWISVNWEGWQFPGKKQKEKKRERFSHDLFITPDKAITAFQRVLACEGTPQIVVSTGNLPARIDKWIKLEFSESQTHNSTEEGTAKHRQRPHLSTPYVSPAAGRERLIADTWQKFFGVKEVGIHDDFFELGGDSLRALQLVNRMKQDGIHITMEKIFLYPTISKICRCLEQEENSAPALPATDYRSVTDYITRNYDTGAYCKNYRVDNDKYSVLYIIEKENSDTREIVEDIKNKFKDFYPNFIKPITSENEIIETEKIDRKSFSTRLALTGHWEKEKEKQLPEQLKKAASFCHLLKRNKKVRSYRISPIQAFWLSHRETIASKIITLPYNFTTRVELPEIRAIVAKIINENSLMRSIIVKTGDNYYIEEFEEFSNFELPFLDISRYSIDCKEEIRKILDQDLKKPFEVIDNVLFRVIVLKLDNSNYQLIFAFNHLIFDGTSVLLLDKKIAAASNGTPMDMEEEDKGVKMDYRDYANFLNRLVYEDTELGNHLNITGYLEAVETIHGKSKVKQMAMDFLEIDISILTDHLKDCYNEILLLTYAKVVGNLYGIDKVPVLFISNGRHYQDGNFGNIIGDFHDNIPVLFSLEGGGNRDFKHMLERFLAYRRYIRNTNFNFVNFAVQKYARGIDYSKVFSAPFIFNSQIGLYDRYKNISNDRSPGSPQQEFFSTGSLVLQLGITKDLHSNNIIADFFQNSIFDIDEIKELFLKNYFKLIEYFNANCFIIENKRANRFVMDVNRELRN